MCGRYSLKNVPAHLKEYFKLHGRMPKSGPRYNISPAQLAPVVLMNAETSERKLEEMRWGLIPVWAKDTSIGSKTFNARAETIIEKPTFKGSLKNRRCIVPASGFYEWQKIGNEKQPFYFQRADEHTMGLAGLWAEWKHGDEVMHSFTIITTSANEAIRPIHHRMPVILPEENFEAWLDATLPLEAIADMLQPVPAEAITHHAVSKAVNRASMDGPDLILPMPLNSQ